MEHYRTAQSVSFLFFLINSVVSKAYWLDEHARGVCCPWCRNMCCISGADCRDLMEKTRKEFEEPKSGTSLGKKNKKVLHQ